MKKLLALSMVIILLAACGTTPAVPAVSTGEDNIRGFVTALFTLPIAEVEAMPDRNEVVMTGENIGYLKVDNVYTEPGKEKEYTAFALLELTALEDTLLR